MGRLRSAALFPCHPSLERRFSQRLGHKRRARRERRARRHCIRYDGAVHAARRAASTSAASFESRLFSACTGDLQAHCKTQGDATRWVWSLSELPESLHARWNIRWAGARGGSCSIPGPASQRTSATLSAHCLLQRGRRQPVGGGDDGPHRGLRPGAGGRPARGPRPERARALGGGGRVWGAQDGAWSHALRRQSESRSQNQLVGGQGAGEGS